MNLSLKIAPLVITLLMPVRAYAQFVDLNEGDQNSANQNMLVKNLDLQAIQKKFNTSGPKDNVVDFIYDRNTTYKIRLRSGMTTTLILPDGESLEGHILGNNSFFTYSSKKTEELEAGGTSSIWPNSAIIEPVNPGVDTNLTIFGSSGNVYSFYLRTDSYKSEHSPTLITYIHDKELTKRAQLAAAVSESPKETTTAVAQLTGEPVADPEGDYLSELPPVDPTKINRHYEPVSKRNELTPVEIFDDGVGFTYFKFGDSLNQVGAPALYQVVDGYDVPVNHEVTENGFYKAKIIYDAWTIRLGDKYVCIRKKKQA